MSIQPKAMMTLLLAVLCSPLNADVQLDVRYEGEVAHDSRVCLHRIGAGEMLTASGEKPRCYDRGEIIEYPDEAFRAVATSDPFLIGISDLVTPDHLGPVLIELSPSAMLDLPSELTPDQRLVIIMGDGATAGLLPLEVDGHTTVVPAATPLIPVIVEDGQPKHVGMRLELGAGETGRVTAGVGETGTAVLLPLFIDGSRSERHRTLLSKQQPPLVTIEGSDGAVHHPELRVSDASSLLDTVLVFRGVGAGENTLRIAGKRWQSAAISMRISSEPTVVLSEPVTVELGSELLVELDLPFAPVASHEPCEAATHQPEGRAMIALLDCQDLFTGEEVPRNLLKQCKTVATQNLLDDDVHLQYQFHGMAPVSTFSRIRSMTSWSTFGQRRFDRARRQNWRCRSRRPMSQGE